MARRQIPRPPRRFTSRSTRARFHAVMNVLARKNTDGLFPAVRWFSIWCGRVAVLKNWGKLLCQFVSTAGTSERVCRMCRPSGCFDLNHAASRPLAGWCQSLLFTTMSRSAHCYAWPQAPLNAQLTPNHHHGHLQQSFGYLRYVWGTVKLKVDWVIVF